MGPTWHGNFSVSKDGTYPLPFAGNSYFFVVDIEFAYTNVSSSTRAFVCELEVNGMYKIYYVIIAFYKKNINFDFDSFIFSMKVCFRVLVCTFGRFLI